MQLPEPLTGQDRTLEKISAGASATLIMFICNHCPFVVLLKGMALLSASSSAVSGQCLAGVTGDALAMSCVRRFHALSSSDAILRFLLVPIFCGWVTSHPF